MPYPYAGDLSLLGDLEQPPPPYSSCHATFAEKKLAHILVTELIAQSRYPGCAAKGSYASRTS